MNSLTMPSWLSCTAAACLLLGSAPASAQDLQAQMNKAASGANQPAKPKGEPGKPGPGFDKHPGPPGEHREFGHEHQHDAGMHPGKFGERRDDEASGHSKAAMLGDAGVWHRRQHQPLTAEQLAQRKAQLDKLREKFGADTLRRPDAKVEFHAHAWRIARLERMRALALEQKKTKLVERIDALIKKENERHQAHLDRLRSGGADAGATGRPHPGNPGNPAGREHMMGGRP